jgi:hypothetical protein
MLRISPPTSIFPSSWVEKPTSWKIRVMVPALGFQVTRVRGMRSLFSCTRRMTNCPALAFWAMSGAVTVICLIWGASWVLVRILWVVILVWVVIGV